MCIRVPEGGAYILRFRRVDPDCSLPRLMPTLTLGSPCYAMDSSRYSLMVVTSSGQLYSWLVPLLVVIHLLAEILFKEYENTNVAFPPNLHFPPSRCIPKPHHTLRNSPTQRSPYNSMFKWDSPLIRGAPNVMDQTQRALVGRRFRCLARTSTQYE